MTVLEPLRRTCVPRPDVVGGGLADNHFAAQLDKVVRDPAGYPVYGDAEQFFAITYPTSGLRTLLSKAFGRVTGATGPAGENGVLRSETSFGGGKTHGLTAVYHLARGARPAGIDRFVDQVLLPAGPVQVAAIVGDALDPVAGLATGGYRGYTLWGEMAAQLGADAVAAMRNNDEKRTAPGTETIKQALGGRPAIVIIDEIAQHLRQCVDSGDEDVRRYARAIPAFLKNLTEVAGDPSNRVSVIITLASVRNAFGRETNEIAALLDEAGAAQKEALSEAQDAVTRMAQPTAVIRPAEDAEIAEILKARLFERIDPAAAAAAGQAYQGLYEELIAAGEHLSGGADRPVGYGQAVADSYPFHPELVRVLDKRLGTIPKFQRARGSLKLLAEVVAGIYRQQRDADVINVADIDFGDEAVANHLTIGLDRPEFAQVAAVDLTGPGSHAAAVDSTVFAGKPRYAARVGTTVFVHSLEMTVSAGAGRAEWLLGTLRPGEPVDLLETALTQAERVFWHLASDGARYRFQIEPNVNAVLQEEKDNLPQTLVNQSFDDLVAKTFGNDAGIVSLHYPSGPAAVPDEERLRLIVIDPDQRTTSGRDADAPDPLLVEILDRKGQSGAHRVFRNSVVFVVADTGQVQVLQDKVRTMLAAQNVAGDAQRMQQFSAEVGKKIKGVRDRAGLEARIAVTRCFRHLYWPVNDKAHHHLRHRELPAQQQGDPRSGTHVVADMLKDEGKIRTEKPGFDWLQAKAWPDTTREVSTADVAGWFWRDHGSPVFANPDLIRAAIGDGIRNGGWVYHDQASGKVATAAHAGAPIEFRPDTVLMTMQRAEQEGLLVRKPAPGDLKGAVTGSRVATGGELRGLLERKCGGEPTKGQVQEVLAEVVAQHRYEWLVVTDGPPQTGGKALTPTQIKEIGLDRLHVLTAEHADTLALDIPERKQKKTKFTASGASGAALAEVLAKVADTGEPMTALSVRAVADDTVGTGDIALLGKALGMLQQFDITVTADLAAEFPGVTGSLVLDAAAERKDYQTLNLVLEKLWHAADAVDGHLDTALRFPDPLPADHPRINQLTTVLRTLNITNCTITGEIAK